MRVLIVDQDSASNEALTRSLRELFSIDAVTNKGAALDLLRSNDFEVIVAAERLEDGSGLELLGQVGKKWPSVLRVFAAEDDRLKLLRGRLGPFGLFQTLSYPIDSDRLIATVNLAEAAQGADTSTIQHVELSGDFASIDEQSEESDVAEESEESGGFPSPQRMPRAVSADDGPGSSRRMRTVARVDSGRPARSTRGETSRSNVTPIRPATRARTDTSVKRGPEGRRSPVRFPPLESKSPAEPTPHSERISPPPRSQSPRSSEHSGSLAAAVGAAQEARSTIGSSSEDELDRRRLIITIGGGTAAALVAALLAFKWFGSKSEPPRPAPRSVIQTPQYPQDVGDLVAQIESALTADDFEGARLRVDKLRQAAPAHPRLAFFEGLLARPPDTSKSASPNSTAARGTVKKAAARRASNSPQSATSSVGAPASSMAATTSSAASGPNVTPWTSKAPGQDITTSTSEAPGQNITTSTSGAPGQDVTASISGAPRQDVTASISGAPGASGLLPETPPGLTQSASSSGSSPEFPPAPINSPSQPASVNGSAAAATPPATSAAPSNTPARRPSSNEPPPVVREAKLIRRVDPEYPSAAKREGLVGTVDLEIIVSPQGLVESVSLVRATPHDVFEKSAIAAVRKWKYDPRFVDGLPSEAHLKVHLEFGPGN